MTINLKKLVLVFSLFCLILPANAENSAGSLVFKDILEKAVNNSYNLKISQTDIKIAGAEIKAAKADYFPIVSAGYINQYDKDLNDGKSQITPVGDTVVTNNSRYLNSISMGVQYNVYDFGARRQKLNIAQKGKLQKQAEYDKNFRNLKLTIAETYTKALLAQRELLQNKELLELNKGLFSMYEKLYFSGVARKTDMADQALSVAVVTNKIDDLKTELNKALLDLSTYTKEDYDDSVNILNLLYEPKIDSMESVDSAIKLDLTEKEAFDVKSMPEYREYQYEIEKKKSELSVLKRQNLPQFKFSTNYYIYGSDKENMFHSMGDMKSRSLTFRLNSTLPVFDGLKNQALREKAKLEIERLNLERDKKMDELNTYYQKSITEAKDAAKKIENREKALKAADEKLAMMERLNKEQLLDKITYMKEKAQLISQRFDVEKTLIESEVVAYRIKVLSETGGQQQ